MSLLHTISPFPTPNESLYDKISPKMTTTSTTTTPTMSPSNPHHIISSPNVTITNASNTAPSSSTAGVNSSTAGTSTTSNSNHASTSISNSINTNSMARKLGHSLNSPVGSSSSSSSASSTYSSSSQKSSPLGKALDPFLSQYLRSPTINSSFTNHQLYFNSLNKQRKIKSLEIYQKYLTHKNNANLYRNAQTYQQYISRVSPPKVKIKASPLARTQQHHHHSEPPSNLTKLPSPLIHLEKTLPPSPKRKQPDLAQQPHIAKKYLPTEFMDCPVDDLINLISRMLQSLITLNDKSVPVSISHPKPSASSSSPNNLLTRYHSRTPPSISTHTYLTRLSQYNNFNPATLLTTIYYIDLLSHQYQPFFTLNSWTVHRFLLVATMLAQKSMEDFFYTNDHYAKVGGVAISELNCLELDFLNRVDWRCQPGKQNLPVQDKGSQHRYSSIRYAKDVLDLYYGQLIELMGKHNSDAASKNIHYFSSKYIQPKPEYDQEEHDLDEDEAVDDDEDEGDEEDEEDGIAVDEEGDEADDEVSELDQSNSQPSKCVELKYDNRGYSIDGSSSPHLKRRYSNE
ncbi:cyclin-domain-containing protein [Scheffersomyces xylosifermentans]|uniref:cyclin-domain-containing protein n=1 Tax=Scheffersomyces xylosifermentans TaxID=1304137 RepID=UPI00315D5F5B